MTLTPLIAVHLTLALAAVVIGPVALWSHLGTTQPRLHRASGYAWLTCLLGAALSSLFIQDHQRLNWHGFTVTHLLVPVTLFSLWKGFRAIMAGDVARHRKTMRGTYIGACLVTGLFTLLPNRFLGQWLSAIAILIASSAQAQVGYRVIRSGDMPITLVYPTAQSAQPQSFGPFTIKVALDAPVLAQPGGKRSLIVMSHGTAGSALADHSLAATLARAGFVVAQPEHRGDNHKDFSRAGPSSWESRPEEVTETIDAVAKHPDFASVVDSQRVGVHGMSAGGVTGLALAGAQWRMLTMIQHCADHLEDDIGFCLNGLGGQPALQTQRKRQYQMVAMLTERMAPESLKTLHGGRIPDHDPRPDPRVAAVSLLVPLGAIFTPESLARIQIPVGLTVAGLDEVLLPVYHSQYVLQYCTSCRVLSSHPGSGHFDGLSPWPTVVAQGVAAVQMRGGLPHAEFGDAGRKSGFDSIAAFFLKELQP